MTSMAIARRTMVDNQLRTDDVTDLDLLGAMGEVAREAFVPAADAGLAYTDREIRVSDAPARFLPRPATTARMIQALEVTATDKVLVIGAGTGYSAAVLARLAGSVVALEEMPALVAAAKTALAATTSVEVVQGVLAEAKVKGPFDVILVDGAVEVLPAAWLALIADGGRLAVVEGLGLSGEARIHTRTGSAVAARALFNCALPLLPGLSRAPAFVF